MKKFILAFYIFLAVCACKVAFGAESPYYGNVPSTSTGVQLMHISGTISVAASSQTPTSYTTNIDGATGINTSKQVSANGGITASSATVLGNLQVNGIINGALGIGASPTNDYVRISTTGPSSGMTYVSFIEDSSAYKAFSFGTTGARIALQARDSDTNIVGVGSLDWGWQAPGGKYSTSDAVFTLGVMTTAGNVSGMIYLRGTDRVGIRTPEPLTNFHVTGGSRFDGQIIVTSSASFWNGNFNIAVDTFSVSNGNVGIGTSTAISKLTLVNGDFMMSTDYYVRANGFGSYGDRVFGTNNGTGAMSIYARAGFILIPETSASNAYKITISTYGWVGIGNSNPSERLDVTNGNIKAGYGLIGSTASITYTASVGDLAATYGITGTTITATSSSTASAFFGDGSHLTGVLGSGGGTISGNLIVTGTVTIQGNTFSVGGTRFAVGSNGNISADYGITSSSFTASTWLKAAGVVTVVSTGLATSQNITVSSSAYITGNLFVGGITMGENIGLGATGPSSGISYLVFVKDFASYKAFNYGVTESRLAFVSRQSDGTMTGSGAMSWGYNGTYDTSGAYFSLGVMTTGGTVSGMIHMRGTDRIGYRVASPLTSHHFGGDVRMDNQLVVYGSMTVYGTDGVQLRGAIDMSVGGYGTNSTMLMGPGAASRANLRTQGGYGVWAITNASNLPLIKFNTTAAQVVVSSGNFILDGTTPSIGVRTNNPAAPIHSIGEVRVSTATTSSASLCLAGTFQTLPTTGWNEGCIAWQLDDHKVYVATQTVVAVDSWKALW